MRQWIMRRSRQKRAQPCYLGFENLLELRKRFVDDQLIRQYTCAMHDAGDWPPLLARRIETGIQSVHITHVDVGIQDFRAGVSNDSKRAFYFTHSKDPARLP